METRTIKVMDKAEVKAITADTVKFDVALKARMDSLDRTIKALKAELEAVKDTAKEVFGKDGGNGIFSTETRKDYQLNTSELIELIGEQKFKELKNKLVEKTYVHW